MQFTTTHWSVVLNAAEDAAPGADAAMESLCRAYWRPLYSYVRARGYSQDDAQDLTQEFFSTFLRKRFLTGVQPRKGRFRCFLLAALKHFLANQWDRVAAEKRGGKQTLVSFDGAAESHCSLEEVLGDPSEATYDKGWALAVLDQAMLRLKDDYCGAGKREQFEKLKGFLARAAADGEYDRVGLELGMSAGAVGVAVHRLRQGYAQQLRAAVGQTVSDPAELEDEMHYLFKLVNC